MKPSKVLAGGKSVDFIYNEKRKELITGGLDHQLGQGELLHFEFNN